MLAACKPLILLDFHKSFNDTRTMEEAETSIERLRAGYGVRRYVPVDSAEAISPALSDTALIKTAERRNETLDELPRLTGFVLANDGYYSIHTIVKTVDDIRRIADWGFNTVRLRITYETLFNQDGSQIDLTQAERLDELVEACIEADIHLNLLLCTLPGRTKWVDLNDVSSGGETDLFINPERQKEAVSVWATLAARYQDVSGAHLSFTPFWEPDGDLGINSEEGWEHTPQDTCDTLALLIEAVRAQDPERFIFYEPTAHIAAEATIQESSLFYEPLKSRFDNLMISYNFCQNAYVFAEITDIVGEDVDLSNYSMFKPEYPVTNYGVNDTIPDGGELTIDGFLPAGTVIDLYLAYADGQSALTITGDGTELYHEELSSGDYRPGRPLSSFYADCKGKAFATDYISNAAVVYGYAVNTLENRLKAKVCELCGTTESDHYEVHHINKLKNLKGKERWEIAMIAKHRKTLVVCRDCHRSIIHKK